MDELTIDEKKYISSKRAADITGYAKDYIGQLCREGYVPAKRVGRNWYVLESAIKDHRFGADVAIPEPKNDSPESPPKPVETSGTTYAAIEAPELPSVNRIVDLEKSEQVDVQMVQDAWQSWFDTFRHGSGKTVVAPEATQEQEVEAGSTEQDLANEEHSLQTEAENVFLQPITSSEPRHDLLIARAPMGSQNRKEGREKKNSPAPYRSTRVLVQAVCMLLASALLAAALLGTGYFDTKIVSVRQASFISGVSMYNK